MAYQLTPMFKGLARAPSSHLRRPSRAHALLSQAVGAAIVLLTLLDVFFTVLFPASGHGPIRNPLASAVWRCFRLIGSMTTGQRRRNFLSYSGPVLFTITFIVWFLLLVTGWAMIYKPALGTAITASSGPTMSD